MTGPVQKLLAFHLLREFRRPVADYGELVAIHQRLEGGIREGLRKQALILRRLLEQQDRRPDDELLALSCLIPGSTRGRPGTLQRIFFEDGKPSRHLSESASAWTAAMKVVEDFRALSATECTLLGARPRNNSALEILAALRALPKERRDDEAVALYRSLSRKDGLALASEALRMLSSASGGASTAARLVLQCLGAFVPGALDEVHVSLADRGEFVPGWLFWKAGPAARARLLARLPLTPGDETRLVSEALAWIGDDKGGKSDLFFETCLGPSASGCCRIGTPSKTKCGWCGRQLVCLLDLDLSDKALEVLGLEGERLRFAACESCTAFGPTYTDVDLEGRCEWSTLNDPKRPGGHDDPQRIPSGVLAFGVPRRTPLEAQVGGHFILREGASQLGGAPLWLGGDGHPECPRCRREMHFVGQVDLTDLHEVAEGLFSAFFCMACRVAVTTYQQT